MGLAQSSSSTVLVSKGLNKNSPKRQKWLFFMEGKNVKGSQFYSAPF